MKTELENFILDEEKPFLLKYLIRYKDALAEQYDCPKVLRTNVMKCFKELMLKHKPDISHLQYVKFDIYVWEVLLESPELSKCTNEEVVNSSTMVTVASRHIDQYSLSDIGDGVLIPGVELKPQFTGYRASSLACVKRHSFTDQQLLSLSNIVFLSPSCRIEFLDTPTSESVYTTLTTPLFSSLPSLSTDSLSPIQNAFTSFSANHDTVLFSQTLLENVKNSNDPILKSILLSFLTLVCEVTDPSVPAMSKMHIQSSFVHPLIRGITKSSSSIIPHCSNMAVFLKGHNIIHCRPDYRVDVYGSAGVCHGTSMFGELKPEEPSVVDVTSDFHKCMLLGKLALKYGSSPYIMTFYTHGQAIHFYLHHSLNSSLSYALHLHSLTIPLTVNTFYSFNTILSQLYQLVQIFRSFSMPSNSAPPNSDSSATVPYPIIKNLINHNKKRKISH